jgi:uncharacterized protein YecT (DUF1311 family)
MPAHAMLRAAWRDQLLWQHRETCDVRQFRSSAAASAFAGILAAIPAASAQTAPAKPACDGGEAATRPCLAAAYAEVDRQLGDAYKAAQAQVASAGLNVNLTKDWKRALQEAQRNWLAYREADCGPPVSYETKGDKAAAQLVCKTARTRERLDALTARYSGS